MTSIEILLEVSMILVGIVAAYSDMRRHVIPDWLTLTSLGIGLSVRLGAFGLAGIFDQGFISALLGAGFCFVLFGLIGLWGKGMGGGDIKLMTAVGAMSGFRLALAISMYTAIVGGILGFALLLFRKKLLEAEGSAAKAMFVTSTPRGEKVTLPYALPIMLGSVLGVSLQFWQF